MKALTCEYTPVGRRLAEFAFDRLPNEKIQASLIGLCGPDQAALKAF